MIGEKDLKLIAPYLMEGKVVNIEVKNQIRGREILLEFEDGRKMVGNMDIKPFVMKELKGITSIASYFARGKYGSNKWRGNCSGLLIKDLLQHYKPDTFGDLAVGSGTSIEVATDLGYTKANTVFSDLNPKFGGIDISDPDIDFPLMDFIFFHPPYYVFPGSAMPTYSGIHQGGMWGEQIHPSDGSRITDPMEFKAWFDKCNANLYKLLHKGGRLAILMGDSRFQGKYYSMFKNMDVFGDIEQVIIKQQHNCLTDSIKYSGRFIPIQHEYLVIIRKNNPYIVPLSTVNFTEKDIRSSTKVTWATVISMILENHNGKLSKDELVSIMERHPKGKNNNHCYAKLRQELAKHPKMFFRKENMVYLAGYFDFQEKRKKNAS